MKRILILAAILLLGSTLSYSQTQDESVKTLFGGTKLRNSGYIGLQMKATQIDDKLALLLGGRIGWLINRTFTIGLAGYGNVPTREYKFTNENSIMDTGNRHFGYGGLFVEYILNPLEVLHFTGNILIGAGGATYNSKSFYNYNDDNMSDFNNHKDPWGTYLIIEPELSAEVNLTKFMKVGVAASYRFAKMVDNNAAMDKNQALKDLKLSGLSGSLYFCFGWF